MLSVKVIFSFRLGLLFDPLIVELSQVLHFFGTFLIVFRGLMRILTLESFPPESFLYALEHLLVKRIFDIGNLDSIVESINTSKHLL